MLRHENWPLNTRKCFYPFIFWNEHKIGLKYNTNFLHYMCITNRLKYSTEDWDMNKNNQIITVQVKVF